jgi:hypothetical protein
MSVVIPLAWGLIIGGLAMCWLYTTVRQPTLAGVVYWTGIVLVVIGLVLLLSPVVVWMNVQFRSILAA